MTKHVDTACLVVLLAVVGLRPLISERYDSAALDLTRALEEVKDASPATTLLIDGAIIVAAVGWLAVGSIDRDRRYRRTGLEWGTLLLLPATTVSTLFAANRRLAFNGAVDWLCCLLSAIVLIQLLRDRSRIRLALCVVAATGAAQAVECFHQVYYAFPETEALYQQQRESLWARQGVALDSEQVELFESRLRSREAFGFLSYSNVAGAHLVLCGLMVAALGWSRRRAGPVPLVGVGAMIAAGIGFSILAGAATTHSRGALAGGAVALVVAGARFACADVWRRNARRVFLLGWIAVGLVALGVVGHGMFHGSLPGRSLDFRWKYWTASAHMAADHPMTGVGSHNFGRRYLAYKTIDSPEEVKNPHSFLVSAATDWGVLGAVGMLALLFGGSRAFCRTGATVQTRDIASDEPTRGEALGWGVAIATAIFLPRVWLLGSDDPNHIYFQTMLPLLAWAATFGLLYVFPVGDTGTLATGLGFALFAFLLQDTVNFATLVPGTLITATTCFAIAVAARRDGIADTTRGRTGSPIALLGIAAGLLTVVSAVGIMPSVRANRALRWARRATSARDALTYYAAATDVDTWDTTALFESARLSRGLAISGHDARTMIDRAIQDIDEAITRDPSDRQLFREKSQCHALRAELTNDHADRLAAVEAASRAVELYPNEPHGRVWLGDLLADLGAATSRRSDLSSAIDQYERALRIDDARPAWERIRRLRPKQRDDISARLEEMRRAAANLPTP